MSGLPGEWQEKDVRAVFASFGAVQQVALAGKTGRGWIEFADAATASSAASQMNGFDAGGGGELDVKVLTPTLLASLGEHGRLLISFSLAGLRFLHTEWLAVLLCCRWDHRVIE